MKVKMFSKFSLDYIRPMELSANAYIGLGELVVAEKPHCYKLYFAPQNEKAAKEYKAQYDLMRNSPLIKALK